MSWVEQNSQGLSRSQIAQEHIYIDGTKLTVRDLHVIANIQSMLDHPTHPRSVIALQECSEAFIEELRQQLSPHYGIVVTADTGLKDQNSVIYDKRTLEYDASNSTIAEGIFSQDQRSLMNLCFLRNEGCIRIINAHLPGAPGNPAPQEFAAYVASQTAADTITIAMGDMNFNEVEMNAAFQKNIPQEIQYDFLAPYCTNIGLDFSSKSIDHFFVFAKDKHAITQNSAEETLTGLQDVVDLLKSL